MPIIRDPQNHEILHLHEAINWHNQRVLEIGCGDARLTALYSAATQAVIGIDMNEDVLTLAQQRGVDKAHFVLSDAVNLPFAKHTFDTALFAWSL